MINPSLKDLDSSSNYLQKKEVLKAIKACLKMNY